MGKYRKGKYKPSFFSLLYEIIAFLLSIIGFIVLGAGAIYLIFRFSTGDIAYILAAVIGVISLFAIHGEYEVFKIRYDKEKNGGWGGGNPYPIGTNKHDNYERIKKINNNLDDINRKL